MSKKHTVVIIVITALLIVSAVLNIVTYNKTKKYEHAVENALNYFTSHYRIGSAHRTLAYSIKEQKFYFGEERKLNNSNQKMFQELSNMHYELTFLYGALFSYDNYNKISSFGEKSLFNMFVDFSVFFEKLESNYYDAIISSGGELYLSFSDLDEETIHALHIIEEITGELEAIRSKSYEDNNGLNALEDYMKKSSEYFHSAEVQQKVERIENLNKQ